MSSESAVAVAITAEISGFREELKKLGPIADANMKAVAAKLDKSIRDLEKAAKASARAGREMNDTYKQTSDAFGKVGSSSAKAAGLLGMFSPQAAAVARALNDVGDAGEVATDAAAGLGLGLGTMAAAAAGVAAVLGVVTFAYEGLTAASEEQARQAKIVEEGMHGVAEAYTAAGRAALDAKLISEGASAADRQRALDLYDLQSAYHKATESSRELVEKNNELLSLPPIPKSWEQAMGGLSRAAGDLADKVDELDGGVTTFNGHLRGGALNFFTMGVDGLTTSTKDLSQESWLAVGTMLQQRAALITKADAEDKARKAAEAHTAAERRKRDGIAAATKEEQEQRAEEQAAAQTYASALDALDAQIEAGRRATMTVEELADAEHRQRMQSIKDQAAMGEASAASDEEAAIAHHAGKEAKRAENARYAAEVEKLRSDAWKKELDATERELQAQKKLHDDIIGYWNQTRSAIVSVADNASQAHVEAVQKLEEAEDQARGRGQASRARYIAKNIAAERAAANEAFTIGQGVQLALAGMNAVQAEMNVLATVPYPATIPAAIAAGATAAADIVSIAAQSPPFHAGGLQGQTGGGPDESIRKFLDGEAALSRQGRRALGDDTINRANAGLPVAAAATPTVRAEVVFGHRHLDRAIRANARRRGTYLNDAAGTTRPGRS